MLFQIDAANALYHRHVPPSGDLPTFVFVNALTGSTDAWEAAVAPALRAEGFGTLSWNFRGQTGSRFDPAIEITDRVISDDLTRLVAGLAPPQPVLVGLSIGGLYAARAVLDGLPVAGLALLNTLREIGPRIAWVNAAMARLTAHGGTGLFLDALFPLLVHGAFAERARPGFLTGAYAPLPPEHGHMNLIRNAVASDWALAWERLDRPTLVITGHQDRVFLDPEIVERLAARIPDARREDWPDIGHLLPQEAPERLAARLAAFGREIAA